MNNQIKQIFETNRYMIQLLDDAVYHFKRQNFDAALRAGIAVMNKLTGFITSIMAVKDLLNQTGFVEINQVSVNEMLTEILNTQEKGDFVLLCDLYELRLFPFLLEVQQAAFELLGEKPFKRYSYEEALSEIEKSDAELCACLRKAAMDDKQFEEYSIEYCTNGDITVSKKMNGDPYYFHSNNKPVQAAFDLARSWYKQDKTDYLVYGLGLAYHVNELGKIDDTVYITVFESDLKMIQLAAQYGVLVEFLKNPRHRVVYDSELKKLSAGMAGLNSNGVLVMHFPTLEVMEEGKLKEKMENYFIQYSSIENQLRIMQANFRENVNKVPDCASQLKSQWKGKTAYMVAAGPSLDKNMKELKRIPEGAILIAVGTVYKKMVKEQIPVDYVIVSDANERVYGQIRGLEKEQIPLLILSTAYHGFAEGYQGPKYLIFQEGLEISEKEAEKRNSFLCRTGGSVAIAALDLCVKMGIKRIVMVGLDLAYTDNFVHARDTSRRYISDIKYLRLRNDIYGREVYTTRSMDKYRVWIENWIKEQKNIEFLNATEGGINIKGIKNVRLKDVVSSEEKR